MKWSLGLLDQLNDRIMSGAGLSACDYVRSGSIHVHVYPVRSGVGARLSLEVVQLLHYLELYVDL